MLHGIMNLFDRVCPLFAKGIVIATRALKLHDNDAGITSAASDITFVIKRDVGHFIAESPTPAMEGSIAGNLGNKRKSLIDHPKVVLKLLRRYRVFKPWEHQLMESILAGHRASIIRPTKLVGDLDDRLAVDDVFRQSIAVGV